MTDQRESVKMRFLGRFGFVVTGFLVLLGLTGGMAFFAACMGARREHPLVPDTRARFSGQRIAKQPMAALGHEPEQDSR